MLNFDIRSRKYIRFQYFKHKYIRDALVFYSVVSED